MDLEQNGLFLRDGAFKDATPEETVERIRGILAEHGIETEERWGTSGVSFCHYVRVQVAGTTFGTNGKGLTRAFARASGYGELMERLQLGFLGNGAVQKDGDFSVNDIQQETVPAQTLLEENRHWYERYAGRLLEFTGKQMTPEQILMQYADAGGNVAATPYHNLVTGTAACIPAALRRSVYTTNGCAAGNTMEEAIVQGISEIVERNHQWRILSGQMALPDVPEETLRKYPAAYEIITQVRSRGIRVIIKDGSLGTKYPVVCACFVDERTGKYHVHFGAYPVFEIALERALTESFQGRSIENVAAFEDFVYRRDGIYSLSNISKELNKGASEKWPGFFVAKPEYEFRQIPGFRGENNRELLKECVDYFAEMGYDVLVRDCSCLGFPTCQILIPGYSEVCIHRLSKQSDDHRYAASAMKALRNPAGAALEDQLGLLMHIDQMKKLARNVSNVHGFLAGAKLSAELSREEEQRMMSASLGYVYYNIGKIPETIKCVSALLLGAHPEDAARLLCLKRYLSMVQNRYEPGQIQDVLTFFHRPEIVEELYAALERGGNPLERYVLRCDGICREDCPIRMGCRQKRVEELTGLIGKRTLEMSPEASAQEFRSLVGR